MRHTLAEWLMRGDVHDPRLEGVSITISEVRATRDLRQATAFVSVLGGSGDLAPVLDALQRSAPRLGGQLGRALNLKYAPRLQFATDHRFQDVARIERLLDEERHRLDENREPEDGKPDGA